MGEKTISAPEDGSSDINKKRRKFGENVDFPSQTRGPQDGVSKGDNAISAAKDVRKEDNTISAEEDNTIAAEEDVSVGENKISAPLDGGSDINKKRRKLGENAAEQEHC